MDGSYEMGKSNTEYFKIFHLFYPVINLQDTSSTYQISAKEMVSVTLMVY